tara:strand:+ start:367 stop:606 length:240 start_codon:yes stop_codon:yes gene_type:complete
MTKKELLKKLSAGPVRCKINGKLRQLTRMSSTKEAKDFITSLDEGANIGVWDMAEAVVTSIQNKDIESIIGSGLDKPDE